ncbi:MAG TPA: tetratricopeptide repeat protein [Thermoanaerobaculia bacterium]
MPHRLLVAILILAACASGPPTQPNDREWDQIMSDYAWIDSVRKAQPAPPADAPRKQQIETTLATHKKLEPMYVAFIDKVREYNDRTRDPRAAKLLASEKIRMGDEYMNLLSRYDKALEFYRAALQLDPANQDAQQRIATAESRRYVSITAFADVRTGMKEEDVKKLVGLPREDWIKQVVQNGRVYSVWIFPKADGGASAIYFDNGVVYHTNWNAAAPPGAQSR